MHLLHQRLEEDGELRGVVARLSERIRGNPLKHAIILDLNPFWLAAYQAEAAGLSEDFLFRAGPEMGWHGWNTGLGSMTDVPDLNRNFRFAEMMTQWAFGKPSKM